MSLFDFLFGKKPQTANIAKERLQVIIAHEHESANTLRFLPQMRDEIIQVIEKYLPQIQRENIKIMQETKDNLKVVKVSIPLQ